MFSAHATGLGIGDEKESLITSRKQLFFEVFRHCQAYIHVPEWKPKSITGEVQLKVVEALKRLVRDFVGRRQQVSDV